MINMLSSNLQLTTGKIYLPLFLSLTTTSANFCHQQSETIRGSKRCQYHTGADSATFPADLTQLAAVEQAHAILWCVPVKLRSVSVRRRRHSRSNREPLKYSQESHELGVDASGD